MNKPIRKVAIALGLLLLAIFLNLNFVQVVKGSDLRNHSGNRRVLLAEYAEPRGQIVVDGSAIATSKQTSDELKYLRTYSNGPLYAPVTGYYSIAYDKSGIEDAEDPVLSGSDSRLFGSNLSDLLTGRNPKGGSVELTLSADAQKAAYAALTAAGARGAVVALDPTTGAILAAVSTPSFDPNKLASHSYDVQSKYWDSVDPNKYPEGPMLNRAFNTTYPAGSTFKVIVTAAALKAGITPDQKIDAPQYYWPTGGSGPCPADDSGGCIHNFTTSAGPEECQPGSATATLTYALAKSCNTAFAALAVEDLKVSELADQAKAFGLDGDQLQIPLPVAESTIGPLDVITNDPAALGQTAFGQRNVRVTPLQDAMLAAAVANNGTLMTPFLVNKELAPNLSPLSVTSPTLLDMAMTPQVAGQLQDMMRQVIVAPEGTGSGANITDLPGVVVGGKTGTADTGVTSAANSEPVNWFTGYALRDGQPKIAVAVAIENSNELKVGGAVQSTTQASSQVARAVMEAYLRANGGD
ncbi:MAG TPA: penicillin-binding transpeptidase domain-containing protein [Jatrophihabitans sp.]